MANRFWIPVAGSGSGNWSDTAHWSATSGGSGGASAPSTADTAIFDANSSTGTVTLVAATTITSLNISGCSLITLSGAFAFSATAVSTYTGGSFTFSNNAVTLAGLTTTSAASTGTVTFSNTGAVVLGPVIFTSSGSNVTLSNTTTMTATTMLINGTGGTLRIANTGTAVPSGLVTITSTGSALTFAGGNNVTLTGGITVTSGSTGGSVNFTNTGTNSLNAVSFASGGTNVTVGNTAATTATTFSVTGSAGTFTLSNGTTAGIGVVTFASTGANATISNSTTLSVTSVSVTGSAGTLSLTNGTTQTWTGGITFTSTGSNLIIGGTNVNGITALSVPVGATSGAITFQNAGTLAIGATGATNFNYASNNATLTFTSAVTTLTVVASTITATGTPSNVTFNCGTLSIQGTGGSATTFVNLDGCNINCTILFFAVSANLFTLQSNLTINGYLDTTIQGVNVATIVLGAYTLKAVTAKLDGTFRWNNAASRLEITGTTGTILTTGANYTATVTTGDGYVYLTGGGSTARTITTSATGDFPSIKITSGTFDLSPSTATTLYVNNINFTGFSGSINGVNNGVFQIFGDSVWSPTMTTSTSTTYIYFAKATGTQTITTNGLVFTRPIAKQPSTSLGTLQLLDDMVVTGLSSTSIGAALQWGTVNLNNFTLQCVSVTMANNLSGARNLTGPGTLTMTGTGTVWTTDVWAGLSFTANPTLVLQPSDPAITSATTVAIVHPNNQTTATRANILIKNGNGGGGSLPYTAVIGSGSTTANYYVGMECSGFTGTLQFPLSAEVNLTGSLTLSSGMTVRASNTQAQGLISFNHTTGTQTITTNGVTVQYPMELAAGGTATLQLIDTLSVGINIGNRPFTLTTGILDLNNNVLYAGQFASAVAGTRGFSFGTSGKISLSYTGVLWNAVDTIAVTGTSCVEINNATATATTITSSAAPTEANSLNFYFISGTYSLTISGGFKTLDFTGFAGTLPVGAAFTCYGDLTFSTGMTITSGGTGVFTLKQPTLALANYLTTNGKTIDHPITVSGSTTGTLVVNGALTMGATATSIFTLTSGEVILAPGASLTTTSFVSSGASARALTFTGNTVTITGSTTTAWSASGSNFTMSPDGIISMTGASAKTFAAGCFTYPLVSQDGAGPLTYTGASLYSTITNTVNSTVVPTAILYTPLAIATTITIASPAVFTVTTGNSPPTGVPVVFTTTISLPTGLVAGTVYYVKNISATTFNVAATMTDALNGTNLIATSGTQSGTHTATFGNGVYNFSINGRSGTSYTGTGSSVGATLTLTATTTLLRPGSFITGTFGQRRIVSGSGTSYSILPTTPNIPAGSAISASNDISLASTTPTTKHYLSDPSGVVSTVQYVGIQDSQALGGAIWFASNESNDYGNNTGWYFVQATANFLMFMP